MPAFNAGKYIKEAIQSILGQSYQNFELIVIDDCSNDDTAKIIFDLAALDARIRPYRNKQNLGIAGNRNKGVGLSQGKYLAWQDADDISVPNRLAMQSEFLELNPQVGIIGGGLELFSEDGILGYRRYPHSDELIRRNIFRYSPISQPAAMIRTEALRKVGPYDLTLPPAEDLDMTFRIGEHYQLSNLTETLVRYRVSDTSATAISQRRMEVNTLKIRYKYAHSSAYQVGLIGALFNIAHLISLWTIPASFKRWIFTKLRDTDQ